MRWVLDTNVIVAAFRSRDGASNQILRHAIDQRFDLLLSTALFLEYEAVLKRDEIRAVPRHSLSDVDRIMASIAALATPVDILFRTRPRLRDAGDEMILEVALNGMASAIVTHNLRDFETHPPPECEVLVPRVALEKLIK
ncbi:MAG: putative toxin-antitoxin system toxin component, PIN family [Ponticaulis sp.]|nr:putative toxin-antitoxin system toxin component, PIN family [Ponticaulis sp.]